MGLSNDETALASFERLLAGSIRLSSDVIGVCNRTKVITGHVLWACSLFARCTDCARSIQILATRGHTWDLTVLARVMLDCVIDIYYVFDASGLRDQRYYHLELCEDRVAHLELQALLRGSSVTDLPGWKAAEDELEKAKTGIPESKRWRRFSVADKLKKLPEFRDATRITAQSIRGPGNAAAHGRPACLLGHVKLEGGELITRKSTTDLLASPIAATMHATLLLLSAVEKMISDLHLNTSNPELDSRLERLVAQLSRPNQPIKVRSKSKRAQGGDRTAPAAASRIRRRARR